MIYYADMHATWPGTCHNPCDHNTDVTTTVNTDRGIVERDCVRVYYLAWMCDAGIEVGRRTMASSDHALTSGWRLTMRMRRRSSAATS